MDGELLQLFSNVWFIGAFLAATAGAGILSVQLLRLRHRLRLSLRAARFGARMLEVRSTRGRMEVPLDGPDGLWGELSYSAMGWTRLEFRWTLPEPLIVSLERESARQSRFFSAACVPAGDPAFDRVFLVQGHTPAFVRTLLDEEARRRLLTLAALHPGVPVNEPPLLDLGPAGSTLRYHLNVAADPPLLEAFLEHALALFRALRANAPAAIDLVRAESGRCPVCAEALRDPVRRCGDCGTPHHGECWSYFGGCAIYACRSRGQRSRHLPGTLPQGGKTT